MSQNPAYAYSAQSTPEEYLAVERTAELRHEYANGLLYEMSSASRQHIRIVVNLTRHLGNALEAGACEPFANDMRVWVPRRRSYNYPDVVVVCGEAKFLDNEFDTLLNPRLVIEVLSPSTEIRDRTEKFRDYRTLDSFVEYVLIAQDKQEIDHYVKRDGVWTILEVGDVLELQSVPVRLPLSEIYARVEFETIQAPNQGAAQL
jgi:Uma2 family endonuclease